MLKAAFANLLAAKIAAAAAVAAAATGGVALAAATGNLPGPLQNAAHSAVGAPRAHPLAAHSHSAQPSESPEGTDTDSAPSTPTESASSATPSPSLIGLCHAFQAGATSNPGKALSNPAFSVLVAAAGGTDGVAGYCTTLIGPAPTHGAPSSHPTGAASTHAGTHRHHPTHPSGAPATHPTGEPTALPTHP